jgi:hypothetical protein
MNKIVDIEQYRKRKYLRNELKTQKELIIALKGVIKSLTKFNKYRRIQEEILEIDGLIKEVLSSLNKKTKELEIVNENVYLD